MKASVGCRVFELVNERMGRPFQMVVLYPSAGEEKPERLGPYTLKVARDGRIAAGPFALAVISHGTGGSHLVYRILAAHLARNGFVVAMVEHPGNNRNNNDLAGTVENLEARPRHIRWVIDWLYRSEVFGPYLVAEQVALIGHSLGGYTALAVAGGLPDAFWNETPDGKPRRIEVERDERVKGLVLLAPATAWYMDAGALSEVRVPILLFTAEKDEQTPLFHGQIVKNGVPDRALVDHRMISNAGHFSFLSQFPQEMVSPAFPPSQDPPGFDRGQFHEEMNSEIMAFLRRTDVIG
jgi:predicted dienelactone hydrolase